MIFALLFGGELYGILGALVALPIAAMVRETVVYLRRHLVLEPWGDEPRWRSRRPSTASRAVPGVRRRGREATRTARCGAALARAEVASRGEHGQPGARGAGP